jgi:hypothetical protein
MILCKIRDIDREILKYIEDGELLKVCSIDKNTYYKTCNDNFLRRRVLKYDIEMYKLSNETWKVFFSRFIYYRDELLKVDFVYTSGDFKKKYHTIKYYKKDYLLVKAVTDGDLELAKYAVEKEYADVNASEGYALQIAAQYGYLDIATWLIQQGITEIENALKIACLNGQLEIVKFLVISGANIHINSDLPFRVS